MTDGEFFALIGLVIIAVAVVYLAGLRRGYHRGHGDGLAAMRDANAVRTLERGELSRAETKKG